MKILMVLMSFDIGGAETHVLELSRALAGMGHDITVASNGGVYVAELEKCGIKHVKLPLDRKNPLAFSRSYMGLSRLIKRERFHVVHAHARIPAFICGLLSRRLHFRFVTSAHWVFKVNTLWRKISDWGEKTIAVSEDIKQYVISNYGVFPDNVSVTINGVDMKNFSADAPCDDIRAELGFTDKKPTVAYVSRMDTDRSAVAAMLCEIAPELRRKYPDIRFVIVGGGDDFDRVKSLSDAANAKVGADFVKMTGARTDINKFIAMSDIFVGVSRAVLEAMSAAKPVVIAGNEGYIGILDDENYDTAVSTNFCCRGCAESTKERLFADICRLMDSGEDERRAIGEKNRLIIAENYSADRMARDCLAVYETVRPYEYKKYSDILFSGYYGFGNMGDDSLLLSIIAGLRRLDPDVRITAFTKRPREMTRKYSVKTVNRFNIFAVAREMKHAKLLISGGGSLLQNNTSAKSLEYYIQIINMAVRHGLRVMVYSNGIGPLYGDAAVRRVRAVLAKADVITLREPSSLDFLRRIGACEGLKTPVRVTADPALTLAPAENGRIDYILEKNGIKDIGNCFAVSLRKWDTLRSSDGGRSGEEFENVMARAISEIVKRTGKTPIFIPVQRVYDDEICRRVAEKARNFAGGEMPEFKVLSELTASEVVAMLGRMSFVIGMRLHMIIYATAAEIPAIGLSYDPKVKAFVEYSEQYACFDANTVQAYEIMGATTELLEKRGEITERVHKRAEMLAELAEEDAKTAVRLAETPIN